MLVNFFEKHYGLVLGSFFSFIIFGLAIGGLIL
jgi:hypothetical protein